MWPDPYTGQYFGQGGAWSGSDAYYPLPWFSGRGGWTTGGQNQPTGTSGTQYTPESYLVDPRAAIRSSFPEIQQNMQNNFSQALNRLGGLGMAGGSPYATTLGDIAKMASDSQAEIANRYLLSAAEANQRYDGYGRNQTVQAYPAPPSRSAGGSVVAETENPDDLTEYLRTHDPAGYTQMMQLKKQKAVNALGGDQSRSLTSGDSRVSPYYGGGTSMTGWTP